MPWVELPNCSVRFLVPQDLAYARSDARDDKDAIALAVRSGAPIFAAEE